ncbi:hypothetical protein GCM10008014_09050 [Paenibacillus silvae]|uniref:Uncharacterized protein n=1 Tax=Paenibacillus silvae TaxID=1325358 RepID=A0ABQ1Z178_9BACL|nr:hypothetical protein [Paenibacillus silvae]GGH46402.1 hypothetical protein GCM10008014_09050 [Paenibacillus silvae]
MEIEYKFNIVDITNKKTEGENLKFRIEFKEGYWADISYGNGKFKVTPGSDEDSEEIEKMIYNLNDNVSVLEREIRKRDLETMARLLD